MNVRLLRRIQKHILAEPRRYDQGFWLDTIEGTLSSRLRPADIPMCGTVGCLAGWAVALNQKTRIKQWTEYHHAKAIKLLGVTRVEAYRLFSLPESWPSPFCGDYFDAADAKGRAEVASRRIDHFIKTKGAE